MSSLVSDANAEILPAEEYTYVLVDPGVFQDVDGYSYGRVLVLAVEDEGSDGVQVTLVKSGSVDPFGKDKFAELPRDYVLRNAVSEAEALDGSRSLIGAHVCKIIEGPSGNRVWMYGTIADCEWLAHESMAVYYLATAEDEPLITVQCTAGMWLLLDMYNFALRLFHKASGALYRLPLVEEKHAQLTNCISGFGNQKWDAEHNMKKIAEIMSLHRSFAAWTRIPLYSFQSGLIFWRSTQRCMDHYYYGQQNRSRPKKLPRSLLEQTPEDVTASKKRRVAKSTVVATPKHSRLRLDLTATPALGQEDAESDEDLEKFALANTVIPEAGAIDMDREAVGEGQAPPDPRAAHPATRQPASMIPLPGSVNPVSNTQNLFASISTNHHPVPTSSTNPVAAVSDAANQNLLVDYLREFKEEKDKAVCKMSKTQLKMFGIISNGKCVNGVPYSDPTQFLSALCAFSRDLGVIYYPTKCKGIFSFDFGQSVFIEEFGYMGWQEISAQCKVVDMTDFSPKAKRPTLPKLESISDLLACIDNLVNLAMMVFKVEVVHEISRLKGFLHCNQNEIKEREKQSSVVIARLTDWTNDMFRRLRMGLEAGTVEMMNEYRTRLHVTATEYANVMTSAMWDSIARLKLGHTASNGSTTNEAAKAKGNGEHAKARITNIKLLRKAVPPRNGQRVCYMNLTAKGCPGGTADKCSRTGYCHFVPKKADISAKALTALEKNYGVLRSELA